MGEAPSLARNRDFVILWAGGAVSELGTSMSQLVFPLVGYAITHSTAEAGLATTGLLLGGVVVRLPAGALVDRFARSRVLVTTNVVAALVYGSLAVALLAGHLTLAHLVIAGFVSGATDAFDSPATSASVRTIVPKPQLPLAYTRLEARSRAAHLIGPPLGGALYSWIRGLPFVVDAVSYAAEAFAITRLRTPLPAPKRTPQSVRADMAEGLKFVWVNVGVRCMMIWGGLINFAGSFMFVAVTLRLIERGTRPAAIGLVETAAAVAGLAGALVAPMIIRRARTGWLTIVFTVVTAARGRAAGLDDERRRSRCTARSRRRSSSRRTTPVSPPTWSRSSPMNCRVASTRRRASSRPGCCRSARCSPASRSPWSAA